MLSDIKALYYVYRNKIISKLEYIKYHLQAHQLSSMLYTVNSSIISSISSNVNRTVHAGICS